MNYEDTKVIYVGNVSYVTLPSGTHIAVSDGGKLEVVPSIPKGEPLQPYPFTGGRVPTVAAEIAIENAIKLVGALRVNGKTAEKGA